MRKKVGDIRGDLPGGIIGPSFNDEYGDVYSALYMLTADGLCRIHPAKPRQCQAFPERWRFPGFAALCPAGRAATAPPAGSPVGAARGAGSVNDPAVR